MTTPATPIPSATGTVAAAGKKPLPVFIDPTHAGYPIWDRKDVRNAALELALKGLALAFPGNPITLMLQQYEPVIENAIDQGAK